MHVGRDRVGQDVCLYICLCVYVRLCVPRRYCHCISSSIMQKKFVVIAKPVWKERQMKERERERERERESVQPSRLKIGYICIERESERRQPKPSGRETNRIERER